MTNREAIEILKMELTKARTDFYSDRRKAIELAINALYEVEHGHERKILGNQGRGSEEAMVLSGRLRTQRSAPLHDTYRD